jgi:hypothetical protein
MRSRMRPQKVLFVSRHRCNKFVVGVLSKLSDYGFHPTGGCSRIIIIFFIKIVMKNDVHQLVLPRCMPHTDFNKTITVFLINVEIGIQL